MVNRVAAAAFGGAMLLATPAAATYSIVGADTATGQVGGAGTSCVGNFSVYNIYGSVPGVGVAHAQARLNNQGRVRAVQRLGEGVEPQMILDEITSNGFDGIAAQRQYGIVTVTPNAASFTGGQCGDHASHRTGNIGTYDYATQGNILTGRAVIDQASDAFEADGCDLADRLMRALEAGADNGEGDSRCTPDGIPSDGAFLQVDRPGEPAGSWLRLRVDDTSPNDPIALLRTQYDAWRAANPCPPPRDGGVAPRDAGPRDGGGRDGGPRDGGVVDAGVEDAGFVDAGVVRDGGASDIDDASRPAGRISNACGCTSTARGSSAAPWLAFGVGMLLRQRRRRKKPTAQLPF